LRTELEEQSREEHDAPRYTARLLIGCADRPGIVAAVSGFLFGFRIWPAQQALGLPANNVPAVV
jgi:hypothetical protein